MYGVCHHSNPDRHAGSFLYHIYHLGRHSTCFPIQQQLLQALDKYEQQEAYTVWDNVTFLPTQWQEICFPFPLIIINLCFIIVSVYQSNVFLFPCAKVFNECVKYVVEGIYYWKMTPFFVVVVSLDPCHPPLTSTERGKLRVQIYLQQGEKKG